jgi:hypothetical protein
VRELAGHSAGKGYLAMTLRGTIVSEALMDRGKPGRRATHQFVLVKKLSIRDKGLGSGWCFAMIEILRREGV